MSGLHFRLITLGRLALRGAAGDDDPSLARRRFKLAVLAVLALTRRPVTRGRLVEMFWGDDDEARARHSLSNALSSLRGVLGTGAITTRDADVAIATDVDLRVDALEFAEAVEGKDWLRAVELYTGPFLDGVQLEGETATFEQWVSRERRRLEVLFTQACAQACPLLARARKWSECHAVARRWLDAEPLSADAAIYLLNAAKAPGDRASLASALEEYEVLRRRLADEFDLRPEAAVAELAARIREQLAAAPAEPAPLLAEPMELVQDAAAPAPAEPVASRTPRVVDAAPATLEAPPRPRHRWRLVAAALAVTGLAAIPFLRGRAPAVRPVVAVFPIEVRNADSALAWLADGLPQMVVGQLGRSPGVDPVPTSQVRGVLERSGKAVADLRDDATALDLARRLGATMVARGTIARDGDRLVLDLSMHDVATGKLVDDVVLTRGDALALADEAAARVLGMANVGGAGPQLAGLETNSVEAYQHYMRALEAGRGGRLTEYGRELDAAIAIDSGFIAVVHARAMLALNASDTALARRLADLVRRHADRGSEYDRMEQAANDAFYGGERERSEALARGLVRRFGRDPRAYVTLRSILDAHGAVDEALRVAHQGLALDSLALGAGSGPCAACAGFSSVVSLYWRRSDLASAAEWARRWIREQPDAPAGWAALAWTMSYEQQPDSAIPLMTRAVVLSGGDLWANSELAHMLLVARRYESADSLIRQLEASPLPAWRERGLDLRSLLLRERGQFHASNRAMERFIAEFPGSAGLGAMITADNERILGDGAAAARRYESQVHPAGATQALPLPPAAARAFCWHHALAADARATTGDTLGLRAVADTLERGCPASYYGRDWRLSHHVRGLLAARSHDLAAAERELTAATWTPVEGWARTVVELAEVQAARGRARDAVTTLRQAYATRLDAMGRYVPVSELDWRMAIAFARAGAPDSARVYADRARRAWRDADPEIRTRLASLP